MIDTLILIDIAKGINANFSNLAKNLVRKLSKPSNKYGLISVAQYYSHLGPTKKFDLPPTEKDYALKKTTGINKLPGRFLKDGVDVLAIPVADFWSYSISE